LARPWHFSKTIKNRLKWEKMISHFKRLRFSNFAAGYTKHKEWSNNNNRLALSVDDKEILCRSTKEKEMARGGLISHRQTVKELDDLLDRM
ncbi:hypothetical protein, partial [Pasteurella multocida]|nr:hypothetical protein [Pasteurella multocida]